MNEKKQVVASISQVEFLKHNLLQNHQQFEKYDLLEFHFKKQYVSQKEEIKKVFKQIHKELILTLRTKKDNGTWDDNDEQKEEIFKEFANYISYVDLEINTKLFDKFANKETSFFNAFKVICSYHNYNQTPSEEQLNNLINKANLWGADIIKIACLINDSSDLKRLKNLFKSDIDNLAILPMGENMSEQRIEIFNNLDSKLIYSYLDVKVSPGQLSIDELIEKIDN